MRGLPRQTNGGRASDVSTSKLRAWIANFPPHNLGVRICVVFNPTAQGDKARRFRSHLNDFAGDPVFKLTQTAGEGRQLAREAVEEGFDTIVAAGGDGTVNEVVNGIADAPEGLTRARLAVLPLGTVNVFALEHGLPQRMMKAWEIILAGRERTIDLPHMEIAGAGGVERRCFIQLAGAGLDARAVELVNWQWKKRFGRFAYLRAGLQAMRERLPDIECLADGRSISGKLVLIGNGRFYGGPLAVFPDAKPEDGLLDVCVFTRVNWWVAGCAGLGYLARRRTPPPGVKYFQTRQFELRSAQRVPVELDGDAVGELPVTFRVSGQRLRVVVP